QGNGVEGKDWQNYANYCIDGLGCTSMIVGSTSFTKSFDGQGYTLKNINIDTTKLNNKQKHIGIFGYTSGATFKNIKIDYQGGKIYTKDGVNIGGFAGYINSSTLKNISLENVGNISNTISNNSSSAGGFVGIVFDSTLKNISLENVGNISNIVNSTSTYGVTAGGFAGRAAKSTLEIISLKNIGNINSSAPYEAFSGGFAGYVTGIFKNISLNNIGDISSKGGNYGSYFFNSASGGFAGMSETGFSTQIVIFENISLNNIGNISGDSRGFGAVLGGFIGGIKQFNNQGEMNFSNISVYFNPDVVFTTSGYGDFRLSKFSNMLYNIQPVFDDIHIYNHTNNLNNATVDQNYWNDFNQNGYISDKINIHTYDDSTQNDAYKDFLSKADTIQKPILPSKPIDPDNPDSDVILSSDDLYQDTITNEIIADIISKKYNIPIYLLLDMLEDRLNYFNMNENQKVEFVAKYFLGGDKTQALEVIQSLNFILAYENNGLSTASKDKFKENGFIAKEEILKQTSNTAKNINDKINQLDNELKSLVISSDKYLKDLIVKQNKLNEIIKAYNNYVALINKGLANESDPEFITLKNQIDVLMKDSQILADLINENQKELSIWQNNNNTENFKVVGAFANVILNTNPKLDQITEEGGGGEDPNKPVDPVEPPVDKPDDNTLV
ncbi:hypothetical protein EOM96_07670, partial [Campylobacter lari]|nr:hypothetical protein [Campylobacter lari]